jgi:hypothetical protein
MVPEFKITEEILKDIRDQVLEDDKFSIEVPSDGWVLFIDGNAKCEYSYEEETDASWSDIGPVEFDSIDLYDNKGEKVAITDEFEKSIMNQIKI